MENELNSKIQQMIIDVKDGEETKTITCGKNIRNVLRHLEEADLNPACPVTLSIEVKKGDAVEKMQVAQYETLGALLKNLREEQISTAHIAEEVTSKLGRYCEIGGLEFAIMALVFDDKDTPILYPIMTTTKEVDLTKLSRLVHILRNYTDKLAEKIAEAGGIVDGGDSKKKGGIYVP